jgi:hypothetical protein
MIDESTLVFNVVWTGTVFDHLSTFAASQLNHSGARLRFLVNACPSDQLVKMERFAEQHPDRVVEIIDVTEADGSMARHGDCLDRVLAARNDGEHFCLIDPDIFARGPFLPRLLEHIDRGAGAVTSGKGVWADTVTIPPGHPGVNGEYFYTQDGFVFGAPHFAIYRRGPLDETRERWGVGFGTGGTKGLSDEAQQRLAEAGIDYWLYDTGKLLNAFLQFTGYELVHQEESAMVHIGGVAHYLAPTGWVDDGGNDGEPDWSEWKGMTERFESARFSAGVIRALVAGDPVPAVPTGLDAKLTNRLVELQKDLIQLVDLYIDEIKR